MIYMKQFVAALIFPVVFLMSLAMGPAAADKFGQDVPAPLEEAVAKARAQRLPYSENYDPAQAAKTLEAVLKRKPDYYRALFNLGLAYHELGDYKASTAAFDRAFTVRAKERINDASLLNTAGWVAMKNNDFGRAEKLLKQAEKATSGDGSFTEKAVVSNLGELYFLTQRLDESRDYFQAYKSKYGGESVDYYLEIIDKSQQLQRKIK